jgi:O-6-methylguanine DNA methyltransferase
MITSIIKKIIDVFYIIIMYNMETLICNTKVGTIKIILEGTTIYSLEFVDEVPKNNLPMFMFNYFDNKDINVNCLQKGTLFQQQVWKEISLIPWGETRTYGDIAILLKRPKAYRAVANACGKNKICLLVPCHRVVGKNNIGGYSYGIELKKKLLSLEQHNK